MWSTTRRYLGRPNVKPFRWSVRDVENDVVHCVTLRDCVVDLTGDELARRFAEVAARSDT
jgi:hypothetical protein